MADVVDVVDDVADAGGCIAARIGEGRCDACGCVFSCEAILAAELIALLSRVAINHDACGIAIAVWHALSMEAFH